MKKLKGIRNYRRHLEKIQEMNLTSDLFASVVFEDIAAVQDVLRILTGVRDLRVLRVEPQKSYRNLYGRSSVMDVWAEDGRNVQYNIEIQIAENEDHLKRSRFIQSRIDSRSMGTGTKYDELPDLYLIFITAKDFLNVKTGITRVVHTIKGTAQQVENGVHEIYANLEYPAEDEAAARLLQFIKDTNNPGISRAGFRNLSNRVEYLKNEEGGAERMCGILESEWRAGVEEGLKEGLKEGRREGVAEGHQKGLEDGRVFHLISLTLKKRDRGMMVSDIADALEEDDEMIERILLAADKAGSDEVEKIYDWL